MAKEGKTGTPDKQSRHDQPSRDEKLAAKLRENLHRRKAQARSMGDSETALPKEPAKS